MKNIFSLFALCFLSLHGLLLFASSDEVDIGNAIFLADKGIITKQSSLKGYHLDDKITRAETLAIALKIKSVSLPDQYKCKKYFSDVTKNDWVCRAVEIGADNGLISRNNTKFRPQDNISRIEVLALLVKSSGIKYEQNVVSPFRSLDTAYNENITPKWQIDLIAGIGGIGIIPNGSYDFLEPYLNISSVRSEVFQLARNTINTMQRLASEEELESTSEKTYIVKLEDKNKANNFTDWTNGTVEIGANPDFNDQTISREATQVKIGSFIIKNGSNQQVHIERLILDLSKGNPQHTSIKNISVKVNNGSNVEMAILDTSTPKMTGGYPSYPYQYYKVNLVLMPNESRLIDIIADSASGTFYTTLATSIKINSVFIDTNDAVGQNITVKSECLSGNEGNIAVLWNSKGSSYGSINVTKQENRIDGSKNVFDIAYNGKNTPHISEITLAIEDPRTVSSLKVNNISVPVNNGTAIFQGLDIPLVDLNLQDTFTDKGYKFTVLPTYNNIGTNGIVSGVFSEISVVSIKYTSCGIEKFIQLQTFARPRASRITLLDHDESGVMLGNFDS